MKIPSDLLEKYPAEKPRQCVHWKTLCPECEEKFPGLETTCPHCGTIRQRCRNAPMENEDSCRKHMRARPYSILTLAAGSLADGMLQEMIEGDERDLTEEYQTSRYVLALQSKALLELLSDKDKPVDPKVVASYAKASKTFFEIAEKRKKIEDGEQITITIDPQSKQHIQRRISIMIQAFREVLEEYIHADSVRKEMLYSLQQKLKLPGNKRTIVPLHKNKKAQEFAQ